MAMCISTVCDYVVVLFALHSNIRTAYHTNIYIYIYIYIYTHTHTHTHVMYGTLRSLKVLEILQIVNHQLYIVTYQLPRHLLWRRLYGDHHEILP